jgi:hypothetical protein
MTTTEMNIMHTRRLTEWTIWVLIQVCVVGLALKAASSRDLSDYHAHVFALAVLWILTLSWSYPLFLRNFPLIMLMPFLMIGPLLTVISNEVADWHDYQSLLPLPLAVSFIGVMAIVILLRSHTQRYNDLVESKPGNGSTGQGIWVPTAFSIGPGIILGIVLVMNIASGSDWDNLAHAAVAGCVFGICGIVLGVALPSWHPPKDSKGTARRRYAVSTSAIILVIFVPIALEESGLAPTIVSLGATCSAVAYLLTILIRMQKTDPNWLQAYGPPMIAIRGQSNLSEPK